MNPKKFFTITLLITAIIFTLPATIVVIFDPFFVIHKRYAAKIGFDKTDRYQNAGLINSFLADPSEHIDTVIIGTSMSQNFPVSIFKNEHNKNSLKLTLAGGSAKELGIITKKAIATGNVKKIIWEVFTSYADNNPDAIHKDSPLPLFLYNDSFIDNWRYIFNNSVFEKALKVARGKRKKRKNLEDLYVWENDQQFIEFNKKENLNKLRKKIKTKKPFIPLSPPDDIRIIFPSLYKNLIPILKENPDIEFELFFPPVSYYSYALHGTEGFWIQMLMRKKLLGETENLKNVHVYGFDLIENTSNNLTNYMDPNHYKPEISRDMAKHMLKHQHLMTAQSWDTYTQTLIQKINVFSKNFLNKH